MPQPNEGGSLGGHCFDMIWSLIAWQQILVNIGLFGEDI
jgi:hypothetical protein